MTIRHSLPTNVNLETGIAYGYISANSLHPDIVQDLQDNGTDVYYEDALKEAQRDAAETKEAQDEAKADADDSQWDELDVDEIFDRTLAYLQANWSGSKFEQKFNDDYQPDEPVHEGEKDGVKYRTSWLGGALNVWVFESPFTCKTVPCSPCVPGAGDLDNVGKGDYECYDVPPNWRDEE